MNAARALFIAYNFAPAAGAGVQRSLKFVKYLSGFGWRPIVLAAAPEDYPVVDESTWSDVPRGIPVYRAKSFDIRGARCRFNRLGLGRLYTVINMALKLPDPALLWPYLARPEARQAIERHQPDVVYSSSGPLSAHWLGKWVAETYGLPWVADFRDRWWTEEWPRQRALPGYTAINRRMARDILKTADRVVTVSKPLSESFRQLSEHSRLPVTVIENGYDADSIVALPPPHTDRFTITYTGTVNQKRPASAFVSAIESIVDTWIPRAKLRVAFAGRGADNHIPDQQPFEKLGFLRRESLNRLRQESDLFLLLRHPSPRNLGLYSGKVFEYLGSNRPTLVIGHRENVAAKLVERARAGVVVPHDPPQIAAAILDYYQLWQSGTFAYNPDWSIITQYTRSSLTGRLAAEFDDLISA
jgi:glycosyltransferase involved in cell wall biosynthesis